MSNEEFITPEHALDLLNRITAATSILRPVAQMAAAFGSQEGNEALEHLEAVAHDIAVMGRRRHE